jgi:hypothetical protein
VAEKVEDELDAGGIPPFEPAPKVEEPAEDPAIAALKAQIDEERRLRHAAEQRANTSVQEAHKAKLDAGDSQLQLVNTAIDTVESNQTAMKGAYAEAMRNGDFDAAAEIQATMADNSAKLLQLRNGKAAMEAAPPPEAPKPIQTDPVEALASQLTPRSAAWVRAHPECARDPKLYQKMIAAHNLAVADGVTPDSDEYFQSVESVVFKREAPKEDTDAAGADDPMKDTARRAAPPPAAPASRGQSNGRRVTLTAAQREAADIAGQSEEEYARNLGALKAEGRIH